MKIATQQLTKLILLGSLLGLLMACSPIKVTVKNLYKLEGFYQPTPSRHPIFATILITPTEAVQGYQTNSMLYIKKPFAVQAFVYNTWLSAPATMLYPLIIQTLQNSHYFQAVVSGTYIWKTNYRLDTQLISLQQNYLQKPSRIELIIKAVLTDTNNRILGSRIFNIKTPCSSDTPYGGVLAANQATRTFTSELNTFVKSIAIN